MFKLNASELCTLAGVKKSNNEVDGINKQELVDSIAGFLEKYVPEASHALSAIAITDGKHPAHLAVIGQNGQGFQLFQVPVSALPDGQTLFPIGAGDAVAAGTLAAWQCLSTTEPCLPPHLREALTAHLNGIDASEDPTISGMLAAFSFGLACGSASCLREENSVLETEDALNFLSKGKPTFLSKQSLAMT